MKRTFYAALRWPLVLLAGLLAAASPAAAQCTPDTPPPGCARPFVAVDVATGQPVQAFCVGRPVRFELGCGRSIPANLLYYTARATPSLATLTPDCNFTTPTNTYTPTAAGIVTIAELSNVVGSGRLYALNFPVYANPTPTFSLLPCQDNLVALTIAPAGYDQYAVAVNGTPLASPLPAGTTTITAPAGSTVTVTGSYAANTICAGSASQTVPALAPAQVPVLSRLAVSGPLPGSITLSVSGLPAGYLYEVQRADAGSPGGFQTVTAVAAGSSSVTLASAPAGQYRLASRDACGNRPAASALVPTLQLSGAASPTGNQLTWQAAGPVAGYTLLRDGTTLATLPASATTYLDAVVACGTRYTYRLQATTLAGSQTVSADAPVATSTTQPPPVPVVNASFDRQNRLTLTAFGPGGRALPATGQLLYSRQGSPASLDFGPIPTATDTLRDPAALADLLAAPPCYTARLQDVCGNASAASPPTCPALLTVALADPEGLTTQLSWTAFRGPNQDLSISYRVLSLAADGTVLATSAPTASLSYLDPAPPTDRQVVRYRIEGRGGGLPAGTASYSNVASLARRPRLVVPDAFTPNGDGLNDVLALKGRYLRGFTFVVVNRDGQEVFRATDPGQTWDGTIRGHAPVNAAYVWRFTMRDETGQDFSQTGTVTILK